MYVHASKFFAIDAFELKDGREDIQQQNTESRSKSKSNLFNNEIC